MLTIAHRHARAATLALRALLVAALLGCAARTAEAPEAPAASTPATVAEAADAAVASAPARAAIVASETVDVVKVVDADTLHVRRKGAIEKLRLLSVDTEERLRSGSEASATKPETVFGEECALWAQQFFAGLAEGDRPARIGLAFPRGVEERDVYGRLLCHVILPDGRDFNRLLVELGKSPYFNKYGNSDVDHAGFVAAQEGARRRELGIWNPATNVPATPGAPAAQRPYDELLPWWDARARAIDDFRARSKASSETVVDAADPEALARAAASGREVEVFGEVDRIFEEKSGDRTVLLRSGSRERALRIRIPAAARARLERFDVDALAREMRQNFVWVRGTIGAGARGHEITSADPARWRRAGPEPARAHAAAR